MGADQLAEIRPPLRELLNAVDAREPNAANLCVTLAVAGTEDAWVQVTPGTINFSFPHAESPLPYLRKRFVPSLPGAKLVSFESGAYGTIGHNPCSLDELSRFVDSPLSVVHGLPDDYSINVAIMHI